MPNNTIDNDPAGLIKKANKFIDVMLTPGASESLKVAHFAALYTTVKNAVGNNEDVPRNLMQSIQHATKSDVMQKAIIESIKTFIQSNSVQQKIAEGFDFNIKPLITHSEWKPATSSQNNAPQPTKEAPATSPSWKAAKKPSVAEKFFSLFKPATPSAKKKEWKQVWQKADLPEATADTPKRKR